MSDIVKPHAVNFPSEVYVWLDWDIDDFILTVEESEEVAPAGLIGIYKLEKIIEK